MRLTSGALWDGIVVISHHDHIWIGGLNGLLREAAEVEEGESEESDGNEPSTDGAACTGEATYEVVFENLWDRKFWFDDVTHRESVTAYQSRIARHAISQVLRKSRCCTELRLAKRETLTHWARRALGRGCDLALEPPSCWP